MRKIIFAQYMKSQVPEGCLPLTQSARVPFLALHIVS